MSTSSASGTGSEREAIAALFAEKPPVLVEVRFPHMGTASDWFLCEDEDDLEPVLARLGPGAEAHLHSVWDVKNSVGGLVIRK